jgi:hypothetical protein
MKLNHVDLQVSSVSTARDRADAPQNLARSERMAEAYRHRDAGTVGARTSLPTRES